MTSRTAAPVLASLAGVAFCVTGAQALAQDVASGEKTFAQCAGCHAVGPGAAHRFGPQLNGILDRGAGTAEGYDYSAAFVDKVQSGLDWNEESLGAYLEAPMSYINGTRMVYPGLKEAGARDNLIAYLATIAVDGSSRGADEQSSAQGPNMTDQVEVSGPVELADTASETTLAQDLPIPDHGVLHLGRPAFDEEVVAWDIDIRPDGAGLPEGSGDVGTGGELYDAQCASCHGVFGEGEGRWPMIAGGQDTLTDDRPEKTIGSYWPYLSTVYDYIRRAMPFGNARSLDDDEVYALTAYLLYMNDIVDEEFELDSTNFADIKMPNVDNFIADTRVQEPWFEPSAKPCMSDCLKGQATIAMRARVLDVTPDGEGGDEGSGGVD